MVISAAVGTLVGGVLGGPGGAVIGNLVGVCFGEALKQQLGESGAAFVSGTLGDSAAWLASRLGERWSKPPSNEGQLAINHDLEQALRAAFIRAVIELGGRVTFPRETPGDPTYVLSGVDQHEELRALLLTLLASARAGTLLQTNPSAAAFAVIRGIEPADAEDDFYRQIIAPALSAPQQDLFAREPNLRLQLRSRLYDRVSFYYAQYLKQSTPAFRAFSRELLEGIRDSLTGIGEQQAAVHKQLTRLIDRDDLLKEFLSTFANKLEHISEDTRVSRMMIEQVLLLQQDVADKLGVAQNPAVRTDRLRSAVRVISTDFLPGDQPVQFVAWCERHWGDSVEWLKSSLVTDLAQREAPGWREIAQAADEARRTHREPSTALDALLALIDPDYRAAAPTLDPVGSEYLDFGALLPGDVFLVRAEIVNNSRRFVTAAISTPGWLSCDRAQIALAPKQRIELRFTPGGGSQRATAPAANAVTLVHDGAPLLRLPIRVAIRPPSDPRAVFLPDQRAELVKWCTDPDDPNRWLRATEWLDDGQLTSQIRNYWYDPDLADQITSAVSRQAQNIWQALDEALLLIDPVVAGKPTLRCAPDTIKANDLRSGNGQVTVQLRNTGRRLVNVSLVAEGDIRLTSPGTLSIPPGPAIKTVTVALKQRNATGQGWLRLRISDGEPIDIAVRSELTLPDGQRITENSELVRWCEAHWERACDWLLGQEKPALPDVIERDWVDRSLASKLRTIAARKDRSAAARLDEALASIDRFEYGRRQRQLTVDPEYLLADAQAQVERVALTFRNAGQRFISGAIEIEGQIKDTRRGWLRPKKELPSLSLRPGEELPLTQQLPEPIGLDGNLRVMVEGHEEATLRVRKALRPSRGNPNVSLTDIRSLVAWCTRDPSTWAQAGAWLFEDLPQQIATAWHEPQLATIVERERARGSDPSHALDLTLSALDPNGYTKQVSQLKVPSIIDIGLTYVGVKTFVLPLVNDSPRWTRVQIEAPSWMVVMIGVSVQNTFALAPHQRLNLTLALQASQRKDEPVMRLVLSDASTIRLPIRFGIPLPDASRAVLEGERGQLAAWATQDAEHWEHAGDWLYGKIQPKGVARTLADDIVTFWQDEALASVVRAAATSADRNAGLDTALAAIDPAGYGQRSVSLEVDTVNLDFGDITRATPRRQLTVHNKAARLLSVSISLPSWLTTPQNPISIAPNTKQTIDIIAKSRGVRQTGEIPTRSRSMSIAARCERSPSAQDAAARGRCCDL